MEDAPTLDRNLQKLLLEHLAAVYPENRDWSEIVSALGSYGRLTPNVHYLEEHGLVAGKWSAAIGARKHPLVMKITARGMDFLADDGGLSAILGVVSVKIHEDSIKDLLVMRIDQSEAPSTVKDELRAAVRRLPADALRSAILRGLDTLLANPSTTIAALRTLLPL